MQPRELKVKNYNTKQMNQPLPQIIDNFISWDDARGITTGSNPHAQFVKLFEEVLEIHSALYPELSPSQQVDSLHSLVQSLYAKGKIKQVPADSAFSHLVDAVGDTQKCLVTVANLSRINLANASQIAFTEINSRQGHLDAATGIWEKN